jgi:CheY-like chemotaxis protein
MKEQAYWCNYEGRMLDAERSLQASGESPTQAGGRSPAAAPQAAEASALPRLLVIDDDYLHRKIICRVAAKAGYALAGAATYDEATKLALENAFDCISLDLSLGQHGGIEMLHYLRGIGCKAPIIIISGADQATSTKPCGRPSRSIWISARRF